MLAEDEAVRLRLSLGDRFRLMELVLSAVQFPPVSSGNPAKMLFQFVGKPEEFSGYFAIGNLDCHSAAFGSQVVQFYKGFQILRHVRHLL